VALVVSAFFYSCEHETSAISEDCIPKPFANCAITDELNPICGCDDVTYSNPSYARCYQIDYTLGRCKYDNSPLLGTWIFLGFSSDGAAMQVNKKVHKYDMYITFKNEKTQVLQQEMYIMDGRSAVNFISGGYRIKNKGLLSAFQAFSTKIGVKEEDKLSENKFVAYLSTDVTYTISGNYLELKPQYFQNTLYVPKDERLIFVKK
jgi:hypothetical protein